MLGADCRGVYLIIIWCKRLSLVYLRLLLPRGVIKVFNGGDVQTWDNRVSLKGKSWLSHYVVFGRRWRVATAILWYYNPWYHELTQSFLSAEVFYSRNSHRRRRLERCDNCLWRRVVWGIWADTILLILDAFAVLGCQYMMVVMSNCWFLVSFMQDERWCRRRWDSYFAVAWLGATTVILVPLLRETRAESVVCPTALD